MLATNFLTAEALRISEEEHAALIQVLGMLERGELVHADGGAPVRNGFNMCCYGDSECGTVACIGGWVAIQLGWNSAHYVEKIGERGVHPLFPLYWERTAPQITPAQAANALRNFLTLGEPRWDEALSA